ncbi:hypothetical protein BMS3Abin03_01331 [bacterium BMS3Abin03]|nr:hypothetical protein BMS3Abin03_01331 [bacterium BMS3Abin03]
MYILLKGRSVIHTKLTLTIEQSIIKKTKAYARKKGRSLSDIIENYLKVVAREETLDEFELTLTVKSLKGSFKAPKDSDYKN